MFSLLDDPNINVFKLRNKGFIKLSDVVLSIMNSYRQVNNMQLEAGGVLLGRLIVSSKNIVVDSVTIPMKGDVRNRHSFIRSEGHQITVAREWKESSQTTHYLGEWHTHPERYPSPSPKDIKSWKEKLRAGIFSSRYLYFVIVGIEEYGVWEGDRRTLKIKKIDSNG